MEKPLYALQSDLDMVAIQVNNLTQALTDLDFLCHSIKKIELEQMCQAAQMRRMEDDIKGLKGDVQGLKAEMEELKNRVGSLERNVLLIMKHLGIKPV